jgi:RNA recognition motif-containing protein
MDLTACWYLAQYEDGTSKGCGIVEFQSPGDALRAISLLSNSVRRHFASTMNSAWLTVAMYTLLSPFSCRKGVLKQKFLGDLKGI